MQADRHGLDDWLVPKNKATSDEDSLGLFSFRLNANTVLLPYIVLHKVQQAMMKPRCDVVSGESSTNRSSMKVL